MTPMDDLVLGEALNLFSKVSGIMSGLVGLVLVMRVVFLQSRIAGPYEYAEILKDTVAYFGVTILFPLIVKLMFAIMFMIVTKVHHIPIEQIDGHIARFIRRFTDNSLGLQMIGMLGNLTLLLFVQSVYTILIGLLIAAAPIIIFSSTILNFSFGIQAYFQTLLSMALWPVLWSLIGVLGSSMWSHFWSSPVRTVVFWSVITLVQIFSPFFCIILFSAMSSSKVLSSLVSMGKGL